MISPAISAIEAMISPVVLITASAVVGSGLTTLFTAVNERMRSMTRERISLRAGEDSPLTRERIAEIDTQLDWLLDRHRLISRAVQLSYATPFVLTLSVIVIAIGVGTQNEGVGIAADVLVVAGALTLLAGLWYAARSSVNSERAIEYEVKRVRSLLWSGLNNLGRDTGTKNRPSIAPAKSCMTISTMTAGSRRSILKVSSDRLQCASVMVGSPSGEPFSGGRAGQA